MKTIIITILTYFLCIGRLSNKSFKKSSYAENVPKKTCKASWYGGYFHGRICASGEIYDTNNFTAASPYLPFNTLVLITNLDNWKSVIVRINDRGPFNMDEIGKPIYPLEPHNERGFDLSPRAFDVIAPMEDGIINVSYQILEPLPELDFEPYPDINFDE